MRHKAIVNVIQISHFTWTGLFLTLLLGLASPSQAKTWHQPVTLGNLHNYQNNDGNPISLVPFDDLGNSTVLCREPTVDNNTGNYIKDTLWTRTRNANGTRSVKQMLTSLAIPNNGSSSYILDSFKYDSSGVLRATWRLSSGEYWLAERLPEQLWRKPIYIGTGSWVTKFNINKNGEIIMAWPMDYKLVSPNCNIPAPTKIAYKRLYPSGVWGRQGVLASSTTKVQLDEILLNDSGEAFATWEELFDLRRSWLGCAASSSKFTVSRLAKSSSVWLHSVPANVIYGGLIIDSSGKAGLFYSSLAYPTGRNFSVITQTGAGKPWSQPITLSTSVFDSATYGVDTDANGNVTLLSSTRMITGSLFDNTWTISPPIYAKPNENIYDKFALSANNNAITAGHSNDLVHDSINGADKVISTIYAATRGATSKTWTLPIKAASSSVLRLNPNSGSDVALNILDVKIATNGNAAIVYKEELYDSNFALVGKTIKVTHYY